MGKNTTYSCTPTNDIQRDHLRKIFESLESEHKRIAHELHGAISQELMLTKMNIELFQRKTGSDDPKLEEAKQLLKNAGNKIGTLIQALHPPLLDNTLPRHALEMLAEDVLLESNIDYIINITNKVNEAENDIPLHIFRILQEALHNIIKHAEATSVEILIEEENNNFIGMITDNGKGFDVEQLYTNAGTSYSGTLTMIERAQLLSGKLHIESDKGIGTTVLFRIPMISA